MDRPPPDAEHDIIARITSRVSAGLSTLGPGDDAAILASGAVWTTDMLVQGTHFDGRLSAADIGYKAVAANVSDLAAMGAAPQVMLLSLGFPPRTTPGSRPLLTASPKRAGAGGSRSWAGTPWHPPWSWSTSRWAAIASRGR